jgi:hypothetical protein
MENPMTFIANRIPPEFFDLARRIAAEQRGKAIAEFFAGLFKPRRNFADIHYRFHRHGLWRGI